MDTRERAFYERLGANLRRARQQKRWTQQKVGSLLEPPMVKASVAQIEAGEQRVFANTLFQFGRVLGVSPVLLAGEEETPSGTSGVRLELAKHRVSRKDADELIKTISTIARSDSRSKKGMTGKENEP